MQLYECTVRLSGSMTNEVPKVDVTAAEIQVLRAIHQGVDAGVEAIIRIKPTKHVDRDDMEERERLQMIYGGALSRIDTIRTLQAILGHHTAPLPQSVPGVDNLPAPKSGRRAKVEKPAEPEIEQDPEPISEAEFT